MSTGHFSSHRLNIIYHGSQVQIKINIVIKNHLQEVLT